MTVRKRRMKTCSAIRTTFAPCRCRSTGSARKRRCLALRSYLVEDGNDHPPLRNGENGGLFACHDPAAERRVLVAGALASRLRRVVLERRRQRGNSRRKRATGRRFASFRRIYEPLSISRLYSANDSTSLESENSFAFDINAAVKYYHDWLH